MITIKTFTNLLNDFAERHPNIHTYSDVAKYDISTENTNYPLLFFHPIKEETIEGTEVFSFQIFLMDLLNQDNSNRIDITSDLQLTKRDIIGNFVIWAKTNNIFIKNNVQSRFTEGFDDKLSVLEIEFIVEYGSEINCNLIPR